MKTRIVSPLVLLVIQSMLFVGLTVLPCRGDEAPLVTNLLENGGLEGDVDLNTGLPTGWIVTQKPANAYKVSVVDGGKTGKKCLQITGEGGNVQIQLKQLPMKSDQRSAISGWLKGINGEGVISLMHRYRDENGRHLNSTTIGGIRSSMGDWTQTAMIEHPEYTQPGANADFIISANGKIDALVDDLEVFVLATTPDDLTWAAGDFESHYGGGLPRVHKMATSPAGTLETSLEDKNPANGRYCLRMRGIADWATTTMWPVDYDSTKVYTLTGKVRVNSGRASIRIDFYKGQDRSTLLGFKTIDATESKEWQTLTVDSSDNPRDVTHITATAVCYGDTEAFFDQLVILAK